MTTPAEKRHLGSDEEGADTDNDEENEKTRPVSEKKLRKQWKQTNANDLASEPFTDNSSHRSILCFSYLFGISTF